MDEEKFKKALELIVRIVIAGVLTYFIYNVIVTQHEYFS